MNANGVLGSLCFPTVPGFVGELFGRQAKAGNPELAITMLRAYNDWHIDELVREVPRPLHPAGDPADLGPRGDGRARCGASRGRAATPSPSPTTPADLGYPSLHSEHWDPFWKACADEGTVVCIHIGSGTRHEPRRTRARRSRS